MKIVVCVKQVIDTSFPIKLDHQTYNLCEEDVFYIVNPADKYAGDLALKIRQLWGADVTFIALGPQRIQRALRHFLATHGCSAIHIYDTDQAGGANNTTAQVLAEVIKPLAPDLILCGSRSLDEGCAEIPSALAELLDLPQATGVISLELYPAERKVIVQRRLERGMRESLECCLPALIAVEAELGEERYASLPGLLEAHRMEIPQVNRIELGNTSSRSVTHPQRRVVALSLPRPRPKKTFNFDSSLSPEKRLDSLMSGGLKEKQSNLLEGEPQAIAKKLVEILKSRII